MGAHMPAHTSTNTFIHASAEVDHMPAHMSTCMPIHTSTRVVGQDYRHPHGQGTRGGAWRDEAVYRVARCRQDSWLREPSRRHRLRDGNLRRLLGCDVLAGSRSCPSTLQSARPHPASLYSCISISCMSILLHTLDSLFWQESGKFGPGTEGVKAQSNPTAGCTWQPHSIWHRKARSRSALCRHCRRPA